MEPTIESSSTILAEALCRIDKLPISKNGVESRLLVVMNTFGMTKNIKVWSLGSLYVGNKNSGRFGEANSDYDNLKERPGISPEGSRSKNILLDASNTPRSQGQRSSRLTVTDESRM
ncbi:hypothetical protein IV203_017270 [Nitzschia inconspicua]|uniref:Uncharacterized protein n=1 Tax=Nitzschia inconspicua TaxID=303405 RepID=A0A9K3PIL9_9STRA|nr:hypothetical protein IV203_017270 [Nitzschia inconspicua]